MGNISKLTPILYDKGETNFNHNGLGKLTKLLANEVDEVLNGEFEAFFEYPANGHLADKIDNEMFIKAKPNKKDEPHIFKVYDYELDTFTQTYLIYARSKNIEDLRNNVVLDVNVRGLAPTQAWDLAKNNALDPVVTTFYSDITTTSSVHWERRSLLSTIAGQQGSMIQYWGGEIKHGIDRISLLRRRGQDNVTTVRHGKNLDGLKATYSTKGLVTAIVPYYIKNDDKAVYGEVVESQYIKKYPSTYYDIIEYNDEELGLKREDEPENGYSNSTIKTALNKVAKRYFDENISKDLPSVNMEIALEDISQTKEYEHFKDFEQIEIGDTITVYSKKFSVNINAKVRRVVYNGLTDKNELVEVGTARRSLYDDVRDDFKKVETELQEGIDHAMASANGKNTNYHGTADPNEIGLVGQNNDNYFRTNGQFKELWIYRDGMWHLEVGDLTGEQIRAEVEQAQQEIAEAKQTADEASNQINTAISNAGFTSLDGVLTNLDVISNRADSNAQTAMDNALNALSGVSGLQSDVSRIDVDIDDLEGSLSLKADNTRVDRVSGSVSQLETDISVMSGEISSKVSQAELSGTIDGIEIGGRNLLLNSKFKEDGNFNGWTPIYGKHELTGEGYLKEYTLLAGAARIEKHITLEETGTFTYSIYAKTSQDIEWRGLVGLSAPTQRVEHSDDFKVYSFTFTNNKPGDKIIRGYQRNIPVGATVEILWEKLEKGNKATDWTPAPEDIDAQFDYIQTEWTQKYDSITSTVSDIDGRVSSQEQRVDSITRTIQEVTEDVEGNTTKINQTIDTVDSHSQTIATIETDLDGKVEVSEYNTLVSTVDSTIRRIGDAEGNITQVEESIEGVQTVVAGKADKTEVTQLSDLYSVVVSDLTDLETDTEAQFSVLSNQINLRVKEGDVVGQINIEAGTTLIENDKLYLDAETVAFSGKAFIPSAAITELTADKMTTGTLNAANVDIINLNAHNIVTGTLTGIRVEADEGLIGGWNLESGGLYKETPYGYTTLKPDGNVAIGIASPNYGYTTGAALQIWHDGTLRFGTGASRISQPDRSDGRKILEIESHDWMYLRPKDTVWVYGHINPSESGERWLGNYDYPWYNVIAYSHRVGSSGVMQAGSGPDDSRNSVEIYAQDSLLLKSGGRNIYSQGGIYPYYPSNTYYLGSSGYRWQGVYLTSQPNVSSDMRDKKLIQDIPQGLIEQLKEIQPKMYQQNDKWHFGYIAQDVERAIYKYATNMKKWSSTEELNNFTRSFAMLHKDESKLSLLYGEIAVIKEAEMQSRIDKLENKLEELLNAS